MTARRRGVLTGVPFGIAVVVFVVTFLTIQDRLPGRIATHFSGEGGADSFTSRSSVLWVGVGMLVGMGLMFALLGLVSKDSAGTRSLPAVGAGTAALICYSLVVVLLINLDVRDPAAVRLPLWHLPIMLAVGVAAWALLRKLTKPAARAVTPATEGPALKLAEGEAAAWSRTQISPVVLLVAGVLAVAGVCLLVLGDSSTGGIPMLVVGVVSLAFSGVRVSVDRRGLTVASVLVPRPRLAVPLGSVVGGGSVRVGMAEFGGWGYRIRDERRGVVLRHGEALSVRTAGGLEYVVTVDDSATAAALLNGLVKRHAREHG